MHMARLIDGSRDPKAYSLAKVSSYYHKEIQQLKNLIVAGLSDPSQLSPAEQNSLAIYREHFMARDVKIGMNKLFAKRRVLKNGELGKTFEVR